MKKLLSLLLAIAMLAALFVGCGTTPEVSTSETPSASENTPANTETSGGEATGVRDALPNNFTIDENSNLDADITIVQALDLVSWDIGVAGTGDPSNCYIVPMVYSILFNYDDNFKPIPELCESYERISDTEWHFKIHENVVCHDGVPLTAEDVAYSLNRTKAGSAVGALFRRVDEISQIDEYTIKITTDGPYPSLPSALSHPACLIVPKHYAEQAIANDDWSHPIGSGRYRFESRSIGEDIKLVRFDDYFNPDDKALNKSLTFKIIPEGSSRTIAIETGAADLNVDFDPVDYDRVVNNPEVALWQHDSRTVWHLGMDTTLEWLDNKLVRQAIAYAIDRDACLQVGHNGLGIVAYNSSTIVPSCLGAVVNPLDMYSYNPEKAKQLMSEANCPGFDTQIIVLRDETERVATLIQSYLAEIGINVEVVRIENAVWPSYVAEHKAPLFITSWSCYWDPDLFLSRRFGESGIKGVNRSWYLNEELDKMIAEAGSIFDEAERAEMYKEIQEFMAPESPEVDLYTSTMFAMSNKDLKGVEINIEHPQNYYKLHY